MILTYILFPLLLSFSSLWAVDFPCNPQNLTLVEDSKGMFHCCLPGQSPLELLSTSTASLSSSSSFSFSPSSQPSSASSSSSSSTSSMAPHFSLEWFWKGKKVDSKRNKFKIISGNSTSTLLLKQARNRFSGPVECRIVRSDSGQVLAVSRSGYLQVIPKNEEPRGFPRTKQDPTAKTFELSKRMFLSCEASGQPEPSIEWFKDQLMIRATEPRISFSEQHLQIDNASLTDAGNYECIATNAQGSSVSAEFTVFVKERTYGPYFSVKPKDREVVKGGETSLRCVAVGLPFPKIAWSMEDGSAVENSVLGEGTYVLNVSKIMQTMVLTCKGSSKLGQVSHKVEIVVREEGADNGTSGMDAAEESAESENRFHIYNDASKTDKVPKVASNKRPTIESDKYSPPLSKENLKKIFTNLHTPYTPVPQISFTSNHTLVITLHKATQFAAEDFHADWLYYLVVVPEIQYLKKSPKDFLLEKVLKAKSSPKNAWVLQHFTGAHRSMQFVLSDGLHRGPWSQTKAKPLDLKNKSYKFFIRLVTDEGQEYSSAYSKAVGGVGANSAKLTEQEGAKMHGLKSNPWILVSISLCLAVFFVLVIIFVIAFLRRKSNFSKKKMAYASVKLLDQNELLANGSRYSPSSSNAESFYSGSSALNFKNNNSSSSSNPPGPIPLRICELPCKVEKLKDNEGSLLHKEYESIDPGRQLTWEASSKEENACRNRYANVVAYDQSRVFLKPMFSGDLALNNDYINANLIPGVNGKQYIATQGPLPETIGDFWRMVWQSNCRLVVMLTKLEERNKVKCHQYWPSEGSSVHEGCLKVTLKEDLKLAFYAVRILNVSMVNSQENRDVIHLQFTDWPEQGVPAHSTTLLHFINRIRCAHHLNPTSPIVLHCSAGVGRTGCVAAIDMCLDHLRSTSRHTDVDKRNNDNISNSPHNHKNNYQNSIYNNSLNSTYSKFLTTSITKSPNLSPSNLSPTNFPTHFPTPTRPQFFPSNFTNPFTSFHSDSPYTSSPTTALPTTINPTTSINPTTTTIDIFSTVNHLRSFRNYMVQSEDQYLFVHEALTEATLLLHPTEVPSHLLPMHFCTLQQEQALMTDPWDGNGKRMNKIEFEFQRLSLITHSASCFHTALLPCNSAKNNHFSVIPLDSNRVVLQAIRGVEGSDYINASFIDGYRHKNSFIASQSPTPASHNDLWRMVWEKEVTVIVMLEFQENSSPYWPVDRSCRFNCYVLDPLPVQDFGCYVIRPFRMTDARDGHSRMISHVQLIDWSLDGGAFGVSGGQFASMVGRVLSLREASSPVLVHCSKGAGKTGVFIGACNVLERTAMEGMVNVHEAVKLLRTQRPGLVSTLAEYSFLYEVVRDHVHNVADN